MAAMIVSEQIDNNRAFTMLMGAQNQRIIGPFHAEVFTLSGSVGIWR